MENTKQNLDFSDIVVTQYAATTACKKENTLSYNEK